MVRRLIIVLVIKDSAFEKQLSWVPLSVSSKTCQCRFKLTKCITHSVPSVLEENSQVPHVSDDDWIDCNVLFGSWVLVVKDCAVKGQLSEFNSSPLSTMSESEPVYKKIYDTIIHFGIAYLDPRPRALLSTQ